VVVVGIGCTTTDRADATAATTGSDPNIATGRSSSDPDSEPESPGHEPGRAPGQELEDEPSGQSEVEPAPHPISVRGLIETDYDGRGLRVGDVLGEFGEYTRYAVTYRSEDLRISGIMNVPSGRGPFPVLVMNHGYIDPAVYVIGQGLAREQDWLARQGYVVLHTDYRNHAGSDDDPDVDYQLWLPYTVDVVNAVRAVKRSDLPYLDGDRVGLLGRSMGGSVTLNALVARPGLVDAAVVYASTSSLAADNWRQFYRPNAERSGDNARIQRTYGLPAHSPRFWRAASPRPYLDRVTEPVLLHHGTLDDTCPISWSRHTLRALAAAGAQARLVTHEGEGHAMYTRWQRSIEKTTAFFDRHLH
jgi:dipeptidyl aminopeptidase/acylaminoacyl peptidase